MQANLGFSVDYESSGWRFSVIALPQNLISIEMAC